MLYVVTACHNRKAITLKLIDSLKQQVYRDWFFLLVDDGSDDGTEDAVKKSIDNCFVIRGDGNLWWGGALHKAYLWLMKHSSTEDIVLLCNDDITFEESFLKVAVQHILETEKTLITGNGYSKYDKKFLDGALKVDFPKDDYSLLEPGSVGDMASTRALIMRIADMREIGGFHPILLPHYGSDYEYTIRACRKGYRIQSFADLNYEMDERATGNKSRKDMTIKKLFSKKSQYNPIYRTSFLLLTTPAKDLPKRIFSRAKRALEKVGK